MPRARAARSKLTRRRRDATPAGRDATPARRKATPAGRDATPARRKATPARRKATPARRDAPPPRPFTPELPFLVAPKCLTDQAPADSQTETTANGQQSTPPPAGDDPPSPGSADPPSPGAAPAATDGQANQTDSADPAESAASADSVASADSADQTDSDLGGDGSQQRRKHSLSPDQPSPSAKRPKSPASDGDEYLLTSPSEDALRIAKGDLVFIKYRNKAYYPVLVTKLEKKTASVKFVYDLVKFKKAHPFKKHLKECRNFTYDEKQRCRESARSADAHMAEVLLLSLEAAEELEASRAMEPVDDPEEYLKTQCDYIVRLRSASASPTKLAAGPTPPTEPSPLCPAPPAGADQDAADTDGDSDEEPLPSPPPPPRFRPQLSPGLRKQQRAYAGRLLEAMLGEECRRHLRALHAGKVPSWRRDAFWRGGRRHLLTACSLGDLESCPELAIRARSEALKLADSLQCRQPISRRLYAEEVLAPEAMLFAISALSGEARSAATLEAELARGAARFRT